MTGTYLTILGIHTHNLGKKKQILILTLKTKVGKESIRRNDFRDCLLEKRMMLVDLPLGIIRNRKDTA